MLNSHNSRAMSGRDKKFKPGNALYRASFPSDKHFRPTRHSIPSAEHRGADVPDEEVRPSRNLRVGSALDTLALASIPNRDGFTTSARVHRDFSLCVCVCVSVSVSVISSIQRPMRPLRRSLGLRQWCRPRRTEGLGYIPVQGTGPHLCAHVMSCLGAGKGPWCTPSSHPSSSPSLSLTPCLCSYCRILGKWCLK